MLYADLLYKRMNCKAPLGVVGRGREKAESSGLSRVGRGGRQGRFRRRNCGLLSVVSGHPGRAQLCSVLIFPLLLPKVESTLKPPRAEPHPRAGKED